MSSAAAPGEEEFVQSLARGLSVIEVFGRRREALSLSEVASSAGISRASARRLLHTLVQLGYAEFDGKLFALRPRILNLGFAYFSSTGVWDIVQPLLQRLAHETGESCSASVLDGTEIVHVARFPATKRIMSIAVRVGDRFPAHASAMGRVLLAALPPEELAHYFKAADLKPLTDRTITDRKALHAILAEVRIQGYAEVIGEIEIGLRSVAVPITAGPLRTIGALSVSLMANPRGKPTRMLLTAMHECTSAIRAALETLPRKGS